MLGLRPNLTLIISRILSFASVNPQDSAEDIIGRLTENQAWNWTKCLMFLGESCCVCYMIPNSFVQP